MMKEGTGVFVESMNIQLKLMTNNFVVIYMD